MIRVNGRVEKSMSKWSTEMPMKSLAAALAVAVSIAGLTAPAAQAKGASTSIIDTSSSSRT